MRKVADDEWAHRGELAAKWRLYCPACGWRGPEQGATVPVCPVCRTHLRIEVPPYESERDGGERVGPDGDEHAGDEHADHEP